MERHDLLRLSCIEATETRDARARLLEYVQQSSKCADPSTSGTHGIKSIVCLMPGQYLDSRTGNKEEPECAYRPLFYNGVNNVCDVD